MPIHYGFDDCSFVVLFEARKVDSSSSILKISLAIRGLCVSIQIVKLFFSSVKNTLGSLIGIMLNL